MGNIFFTSDLHFGHQRIIDMAYRPFSSVDQMNQTIIDNINARVTDEDDLIIVGDAVMGTFLDNVHLLGELNGRVHLIPGNHDRVHPAYHETREHKRVEFRQAYEQYVKILPLQLELEQFNATVCHFPFSGDHTDEERYTEYRPTDRGQFLIHGHTHGMWRQNGRQIDVGVDAWDFYPVDFGTLGMMFLEGNE